MCVFARAMKNEIDDVAEILDAFAWDCQAYSGRFYYFKGQQCDDWDEFRCSFSWLSGWRGCTCKCHEK